MTVARAAPTTMAATAIPLAWFGVGVAIMPGAMAVAALSARSAFQIKPTILTIFYMGAPQCNTLMKIKCHHAIRCYK